MLKNTKTTLPFYLSDYLVFAQIHPIKSDLIIACQLNKSPILIKLSPDNDIDFEIEQINLIDLQEQVLTSVCENKGNFIYFGTNKGSLIIFNIVDKVFYVFIIVDYIPKTIKKLFN